MKKTEPTMKLEVKTYSKGKLNVTYVLHPEEPASKDTPGYPAYVEIDHFAFGYIDIDNIVVELEAAGANIIEKLQDAIMADIGIDMEVE